MSLETDDSPSTKELAPGSADTSDRFRTAPCNALLILALTGILSLIWSHNKLLWIDEIMELQTDSLPSLRQLIHVQTHFPISLDPLVYHALAHFSLRLLGVSAQALRLPALLGFLLMQICLGVLVRRIASERAAIFAMAIPAGSATLYFSAEGRPYGLLMGLCALMMLAWQSATRRDSHRASALIALGASIALALNTHYYGVLLLVPLAIAEAVRALERRRLDLAVLGSIAAGIASLVFAMPFKNGASEFQQHYYTLDLTARQAVQAFPALLLDESYLSPLELRLFVLSGWVLGGLLLWVSVRLLRNPARFPRHEVLLVIAVAAVPVWGYLFERFVTHTLEPRHVCEAICGIAVLGAIGMDKLLPQRWSSRMTVCLVAILILLPNVAIVRRTVRDRPARLLSPAYRVPADVVAQVLASPTQLLYTPNVALFDQLTTYAPDAWVRSHLVLVYSEQRELRYAQRDTFTITALHMKHFTSLNIIDFDEIAQQHGEHIFMAEGRNSFYRNWLVPSLKAQGDAVTQIPPNDAKVEFLSVRFNPSSTRTPAAGSGGAAPPE